MRRKPNAFQELQTFLARRFFITLQHFYLRQRQVLNNGEVREQLKVLEHHANVRAKLGEISFLIVDFGAVDNDLTLLHRLQSVDGFNQRRFTGAGRPAYHHHVAFFDFGGAVGQHLKVPIPFRNIFQGNHYTVLFFSQLTNSDALKLITK